MATLFDTGVGRRPSAHGIGFDGLKMEASRLETFLSAWSQRAGASYSVLRPRLRVDGGEQVSVDALIAGPALGLYAVNVWWSTRIPERAADRHLQIDFDGHKVSSGDPAQELERFVSVLKNSAGHGGLDGVPLRSALLLPFVETQEQLAACRKVWPGSGVDLIATSLGGPGQVPITSWKGEIVERIVSSVRPVGKEILHEPAFIKRLNRLASNACRFLSEIGKTADASTVRGTFERIGKDPLSTALLGTFSSGKTTFLNCIAKPYTFPVKDTPTTANKVVIGYGECVQAEVRYHDSRRLERLAREIESLRSRGTKNEDPLGLTGRRVDPCHPVAGTTRRVTSWREICDLITDNDLALYIDEIRIALPIEDLKGLEIIDLPGTDSHIPWHREVAEEAVTSVDAVLYLFRAIKPFTEHDQRLLYTIALRKRLTQSGRYLFAANKIDGVRPAEREAVLSRIEGRLEAEFGIHRPVVRPACFFLGALEPAVFSTENSEELRTARKTLRMMELDLDIPGARTPDAYAEYSGIYSIGEFVQNAIDEKELWQLQSWLDSVRLAINAAREDLVQQDRTLQLSIDDLLTLKRTLDRERVRVEREFEAVTQDHSERVHPEIRSTCSGQALRRAWEEAIDAHCRLGDEGKNETQWRLQRRTTDWVKERADDLNTTLAGLKSALVKEQHQILERLGQTLTDNLRRRGNPGSAATNAATSAATSFREIERRVESEILSEEMAARRFEATADLFAMPGFEVNIDSVVSKQIKEQLNQAVVGVTPASMDLLASIWRGLRQLFTTFIDFFRSDESILARERSEMKSRLSYSQAEEIAHRLVDIGNTAVVDMRTKACALFNAGLARQVEIVDSSLEKKGQSPERLVALRSEIGRKGEFASSLLAECSEIEGSL